MATVVRAEGQRLFRPCLVKEWLAKATTEALVLAAPVPLAAAAAVVLPPQAPTLMRGLELLVAVGMALPFLSLVLRSPMRAGVEEAETTEAQRPRVVPVAPAEAETEQWQALGLAGLTALVVEEGAADATVQRNS